MAQQQHVTYVSDLSGDEITDNDRPTLHFGWDGSDYRVDLTGKEAEKFYKAVQPYLEVAEKVSGQRRRGPNKTIKTSDTGASAAEIRAWAQSNGHEVPERGRIPGSVRDAYEAAN